MNRRLGAVLVVLAGTAPLIWPALLNGYPILFSDTGGLLDMGLLPSMGWDKPFVYGPLIAALSLHLTLWLPLLAQAALLSYTLWATQYAFADVSPRRHVALCLALAIGTACPWFASTLMPDALTPIAALALAANLGRLPRGHRLAMAVIAAVAIAAHLSHLTFAAALVVALAILRRSVPLHALGSLVAALLFLVASNWIGHGRPAVSPYGSVFALARLVGDGPARDYLDRACPEAAFILCRWRDKLTSDSDQFLWDPQGPFWSDPAPLPQFAAEASQIVTATVRAYPLRVLRDALRNGAAELVRVDIGDTLGPDYLDAAVRGPIERWYPSGELQRFEATAQMADKLRPSANAFIPLHRAVLAVGLLACAAILVRGLRAPSPRSGFAALMLVAVAVNALTTGALSTVHDRYEARIAWIILLPTLFRFAPQAASSVTFSAGARRTAVS